MIRGFKHRGLKRLYEKGDRARLSQDLVARCEEILTVLDVAHSPQDADLPGYRMHALRGKLKGYWSISVTGNWRIIFRFENGDIYDVSLVDYH